MRREGERESGPAGGRVRGRGPAGRRSAVRSACRRRARGAPGMLAPGKKKAGREARLWFEFGWWRRGGSNSRPSHCERDALPAELRPHGARHYIQAGQAGQMRWPRSGGQAGSSGIAGRRRRKAAGQARASSEGGPRRRANVARARGAAPPPPRGARRARAWRRRTARARRPSHPAPRPCRGPSAGRAAPSRRSRSRCDGSRSTTIRRPRCRRRDERSGDDRRRCDRDAVAVRWGAYRSRGIASTIRAGGRPQGLEGADGAGGARDAGQPLGTGRSEGSVGPAGPATVLIPQGALTMPMSGDSISPLTDTRR